MESLAVEKCVELYLANPWSYRSLGAGTIEQSFLRVLHGLDRFDTLDSGHLRAVFFNIDEHKTELLTQWLRFFWEQHPFGCVLARRLKDGFNRSLKLTIANPRRDRDLDIGELTNTLYQYFKLGLYAHQSFAILKYFSRALLSSRAQSTTSSCSWRSRDVLDQFSVVGSRLDLRLLHFRSKPSPNFIWAIWFPFSAVSNDYISGIFVKAIIRSSGEYVILNSDFPKRSRSLVRDLFPQHYYFRNWKFSSLDTINEI